MSTDQASIDARQGRLAAYRQSLTNGANRGGQAANQSTMNEALQRARGTKIEVGGTKGASAATTFDGNLSGPTDQSFAQRMKDYLASKLQAKMADKMQRVIQSTPIDDIQQIAADPLGYASKPVQSAVAPYAQAITDPKQAAIEKLGSLAAPTIAPYLAAKEMADVAGIPTPTANQIGDEVKRTSVKFGNKIAQLGSRGEKVAADIGVTPAQYDHLQLEFGKLGGLSHALASPVGSRLRTQVDNAIARMKLPQPVKSLPTVTRIVDAPSQVAQGVGDTVSQVAQNLNNGASKIINGASKLIKKPKW